MTILTVVEPFFTRLCPSHFLDLQAETGLAPLVVSGASEGADGSCDDCQYELANRDSDYDDGDYPGVEIDENMSRIEGDDFWNGEDGGDY